MTRYIGLFAIGLALAVAGCGGSGAKTATTTSGASSTSSAPGTSTSGSTGGTAATVSTKSLAGLGAALVDSHGRTLYIFRPDKHAKVTCVGTCAELWPPVKVASGSKPTVSGGVRASLLGSDPDPEGGRVLTYAGWPLYTYIADSSSGAATGQGLDANGGLWYAIAPSGAVITKAP